MIRTLRPSRAAIVTLALTLVSPTVARAGGFELTPPGARANGRGGSEFASGDSAMSLFYNPAGLVLVQAPVSVDAAFQLHWNRRCYAGMDVDETGATPTAGTSYPELCGDSGVTALPEIAGTVRVRDDLVLGFGLYVPPAGARHITFGNVNTGTYDPDGSGTMMPIPAPTRYQLMESNLLQLFFTVGAAYAPSPRFRVGGTLGWGITTVSFSNAAYARLNVVPNLVTAYADARSALDGIDAFVPRFSLGVSGEPIPDVPITFGGSFDWTGNVRTDTATLDVHSISTRIEPAAVGALIGPLAADAKVTGVHVNVPQTSRLGFGARYAHRLDRPADSVGDRLSNERFDVELGVSVLFAKRVRSFGVDLPDAAEVVVPSPAPAIIPDQHIALPDRIDLAHHWQNQVALSLGADVNPIPGRLGLRAGIRYETSGVSHGYEQIDFTPFRNVSMHVGGTVRVVSRLDLSFALGHIRYPDVDVSAADARIRRIVSGDADPASTTDASIANAGTYRNRATTLMFEASVRIGRLATAAAPTPRTRGN